ncbi:PAS domain S-box protein [Oscillatoriales cyanobacterium LEGE 11467]|uniref:histidine kinase n=1 Tax=Zarconia navalis LEGE 11467 TaxID=1828826 RepID=A0A928VYI2_9CYAN|nr:PAS domain S-box protein [Zarconia navalis]MBE9041147.1 PAS domain S-box protein [Zarconia navalis LEGE 11467]
MTTFTALWKPSTPKIAEAFAKQRQAGESTDIEYRIVRPDGERRWIHDRSFPIRDESGQVCRLAGIAEDITERKQTELALQELKKELKQRVEERTAQLKQTNRQLEYEIRERQQIEVSLRFFEERFRTIFEQAAVGINIGSADGRFIQINQKTCDIIGYSADELQTKTRLDTIAPQYRQAYRHRSEAIFRGECHTFSIELQLIHKEGHPVWVNITVSILSTRDGNPRYDVAIVEDISDRKRIERELRTSQQKYKTLFETLPIGVGMTDETGNFIEANAALERIVGISIGDGRQYTCHEPPWQPMGADGIPMLPEELASVAALTESRIVEDCEERITNGNGEITWLSVTAAPIPLDRYGVAIAYLDITERKQTEQMKDEFIAIASHELRTPLTSLRASLGLLATGKLGNLSDSGKRLLEFAVLDTQRLVRLVNDILDLQHLKFGAQALNFQACPLDRPIQQAVSVIEPIAQNAGITLSICSVSEIAYIDPDSIVQVLTNLLANAIKFSSRGETVWLSVSSQEGQLCVSVTDCGRGIPVDKLGNIFEPFSQVNTSDSPTDEGTGLGLAICRSIIDRHGGRIWVESSLGEGSTFYFTVAVSTSGRSQSASTSN